MSSSAGGRLGVSAETRNAAILATICSAVMIAFQTASKVIRDTMFFDAFDVTALPMMVIGTAAASIVFAIPVGRLMRVLSPARIIPTGFVISTVLLMVEWAFARAAPRATAVAVYLHFGALGAVLISGFWSLINERFDVHSAKLYVSRIAGGATLGGLAGGIIAERLSSVLEAAAGIPVLAAFHAVCAVITFYLVAGHKRGSGVAPPADKSAIESNVRPGDATRDNGDGESMLTGLAIVTRVPYLRNLAGLVLLTTTAAGLLDYLFKAAAVAEYVEKAERQRFFAIFYTASALATFLIQALFGARVLNRFGIGVTMGVLPVIAGLGSVANLLFPGIWTSTTLRGGELALRSSLFRAGYEQHYAPIPRSEKRPAKSVIDVVVERAGDAVGGGLIQLFLMFVASNNPLIIKVLAGASCVLYVIAIVIVQRLRAGYVQAVEKSLVERAIDLEAIDAHTRSHMSISAVSPYDSLRNARLEHRLASESKSLTMQSLQQIPPIPASEIKGAPRLGSEHLATQDHLVAICADLRSRDKARVKRALKAFASVDRPPVSLAVPLLAWDDVAPMVVETLRLYVDRHCGTLLDALFDQSEEFTIRRRVPRVLAAATSQRAVDGLVAALTDRRFEIRYRAAIALVLIRSRAPEVAIDADTVFDAIRVSVTNDARVTASRTIVDRLPDDDSSLLGEVLEERLDRGLELVFALLSLVLDPQHVRVAFQGIHTDDPALHGLALEYLDSVLPDQLRVDVMRLVSADERAKSRAKGAGRDQRQVVEDLLRSRESIVMNLAALKKESARTANDPRTTDD